jgi:hypothetical protein
MWNVERLPAHETGGRYKTRQLHGIFLERSFRNALTGTEQAHPAATVLRNVED